MNLYFTYTDDIGSYTARKYTNGTYTNLQNYTSQKTAIAGKNVIKISYKVKDGGPLDADGLANGEVVDPVGLGMNVNSSPGITNLITTGRRIIGYLIFGAAIVISSVKIISSLQLQNK